MLKKCHIRQITLTPLGENVNQYQKESNQERLNQDRNVSNQRWWRMV